MLQRFHTHTPLLFIDVHLHFMIKVKKGFAFQLTQSSAFQLAQSSVFLHLDLIILFFQDTFPGILDSLPWTTCLTHTRLSLWMLQRLVEFNLRYCLLYMVYNFLPYHKYLSLAPFLPCLRVPLVIFSLFREWLLLMS